MYGTWLCLERTSYLALYIILNLLFIINKVNTFDYQQTTKETSEERSTSIPIEKEHFNTLNDDIERAESPENEHETHSRKKRLIWITDDGRLALPPGTTLTITPTIGLPLIRHPPEGFFSNVSISFPLTIDFDKLGLTDNQNPLGDLPPLFARSFGYTTGEILSQYLIKYLHYKKKRDLTEQQANSKPFKNYNYYDKNEENNMPPSLPERFQHIFHGGERVILYGMIENFLSTFGLDGKACLLRTICEVHSRNLQNYGVFGEMVKLFLTATKSPFASLIPDYVKAQETGEGHAGPGECFPYYKDCPKSIFKTIEDHKYTENFSLTEYYEHEALDITKKTQQPLGETIQKEPHLKMVHVNDKKYKDFTSKIKKKFIM